MVKIITTMDPPAYSRLDRYRDDPNDPNSDAVSLEDNESVSSHSPTEASDSFPEEISLPVTEQGTAPPASIPSAKEGCRQLLRAFRYHAKPYCAYVQPYYDRVAPPFRRAGSVLWRFRLWLVIVFTLSFAVGMTFLGLHLHREAVLNKCAPVPLDGPLEFTSPRAYLYRDGRDVVRSRHTIPLSFGDIGRLHAYSTGNDTEGQQLPSLRIFQNMTGHDTRNRRGTAFVGNVVVRHVDETPGVQIQPAGSGYLEIETLRNDQSAFVDADFDAATQTLRIQMASGMPASHRDWVGPGPQSVLRVTVWVPSNSALDRLYIKTYHLGIRLADDLDLFVATNGTLASLDGGIDGTAALTGPLSMLGHQNPKYSQYKQSLRRQRSGFLAMSLNVTSSIFGISGTWAMGDHLLFQSSPSFIRPTDGVTIYKPGETSSYFYEKTTLLCQNDDACKLSHGGCCRSWWAPMVDWNYFNNEDDMFP